MRCAPETSHPRGPSVTALSDVPPYETTHRRPRSHLESSKHFTSKCQGAEYPTRGCESVEPSECCVATGRRPETRVRRPVDQPRRGSRSGICERGATPRSRVPHPGVGLRTVAAEHYNLSRHEPPRCQRSLSAVRCPDGPDGPGSGRSVARPAILGVSAVQPPLLDHVSGRQTAKAGRQAGGNGGRHTGQTGRRRGRSA